MKYLSLSPNIIQDGGQFFDVDHGLIADYGRVGLYDTQGAKIARQHFGRDFPEYVFEVDYSQRQNLETPLFG